MPICQYTKTLFVDVFFSKTIPLLDYNYVKYKGIYPSIFFNVNSFLNQIYFGQKKNVVIVCALSLFSFFFFLLIIINIGNRRPVEVFIIKYNNSDLSRKMA